MRLRKALLLLSLAFCVLPPLRADGFREQSLRQLTKGMGLAGETVFRIITDRERYVWLATSNGVSTFNGHRILTVPFEGDWKGKIYIYDICENRDGTIFAATPYGVFQLAPSSGMFRRVCRDINAAGAVFSEDGRLYVGNNEGLHVYELGGKCEKREVVTVVSSPISIDNGVREILSDGDGGVWFLSKFALNHYDKAGNVDSHALASRMAHGAAMSRLAIYGSKFFLGTKNNGLYVYDSTDNSLDFIDGVGNVITLLHVTADGKLCVSSDGYGAFLLDADTGSILERFCLNGEETHSLPTDAVYCYYRTPDDVDWFGMYRYGAAYTYRKSSLFRTYSFGDFTTENLDVRCFGIADSVMMIGTPGGIILVDEKVGSVRRISSEQLGGQRLVSQILYHDGYYYVASYDSGLRRIDAKTFDVRKVDNEPLLATATVHALTVSPAGELWAGTSEGIFIFDKRGKVTRFTENNSRIRGFGATSITFDGKGHAWIGSTKGLTFYTAATRQFESEHFPTGFFNDEVFGNINVSHDGKLLFSTPTAVYYSDLDMKDFGKFRFPASLPIADHYSFLDDLQGHYWVTTEDGLFCIDYDMSHLIHFGFGEGLNCQLINKAPLVGDKDGNIWVCTSNGLISANTKDLAEWQQNIRYKVAAFDIHRGNDLLDFVREKEMNAQKRLLLRWNFGSQRLSLRPILIDYACPFGRVYEWRVNGADAWQVLKDGERIVVDGLSLGRHTFEMRLAGAPGTSSSYTLTVLPSRLAILEFVFLIAVIAALVFWRRYLSDLGDLLSEREEIEEALLESEEVLRSARDAAQMELLSADGENGKGTEKYSRVHLDREECADIVRCMKAYLDESKAYSSPDFKMGDLAKVLRLSPSKLSQVFTLYLNVNYYDFINAYRLEHFKRLIAEEQYKRYTLTALSEQCGFKKSSFFSTFRKEEGMTPTEYLKKYGK